MPTDAPPLTDPAGRHLADLVLDESLGLRWAVVTAQHAPAEAVAPALLAAYPGHRAVVDDDALTGLLVAAGGVVRRRAHDYEYDLTAVPPTWADRPAPEGFALSGELDVVRLGPVKAAANPPGHPDHEDMDHVADLREMLSGRVIGPNVAAATWQVSSGDGPCGAVVVSERPSREHGVVAWVLDVFVDPVRHGRGLGGVLLRRSLAGAARAGYARTGLVVSEGNPARGVYEALGFRHLRSGASVDLPG